MVSSSKLFDKLRAQPKGDWRIEDIAKVCASFGFEIIPPTRGSHWKVVIGKDHITIPAHRPIKPVYIKNFIKLADTYHENQQ